MTTMQRDRRRLRARRRRDGAVVRRVLWPALALAGVAWIASACAPPRVQTTFLRSVDLVDMTEAMAQSLAGDDLIAARRTSDDPWIISIDRVVNRTNQIIPDREKWLYVGRLRARLAQSSLSSERRLLWIIPPERWSAVSEELGEAAPPEIRLAPTHLLTAEFHALTTTDGGGRSDAYLCSYQLLALETGRIIWEDAWEVKRAARGRTYD